MSDIDRFNYLEGKIWALEPLLGAALRSSGASAGRLDAVVEQARKGYPGARGANEFVAKGFEQTVNHVRNWRQRNRQGEQQ